MLAVVKKKNPTEKQIVSLIKKYESLSEINNKNIEEINNISDKLLKLAIESNDSKIIIVDKNLTDIKKPPKINSFKLGSPEDLHALLNFNFSSKNPFGYPWHACRKFMGGTLSHCDEKIVRGRGICPPQNWLTMHHHYVCFDPSVSFDIHVICVWICFSYR